MPYTDPIDPPEGGNMLKAADLLGQFCLLKVTGEHLYPASPELRDEAGNVVEKEKKAQRAVEVTVWTFDRAGFTDGTFAETPTATELRIGWWKAVAQLDEHEKANPGGLLGCKPMQETEGNARYLAKIGPNATEIAAKLADEIDAQAGSAPSDEEDGEEPF
jgi:hypothetical protein